MRISASNRSPAEDWRYKVAPISDRRTKRSCTTFASLFFAALFLLFFQVLRAASATPPVRAADLDTLFRQPPASAKPWVIWYWMNAAVSREGIAADLAAMKDAGIGGAYLMPVRGPTEPPQITPPVVQLSPPWWECVRFAFAEADRLGLKLAMQDCDGFATAGGPWITPELSMQKVVWTETTIEGGRHIDMSVPQPVANEGFYRDIAVFALPVAEAVRLSGETLTRFATNRNAASPKVTSNATGPAPQFLAVPGGTETFRSDAACWIQYAFAEPFTCRAIMIQLPPAPNAYQPNTYHANRLAVEASDDGEHFRRVAQLVPPRHGWQDGDADITHAIVPTIARYFRFVFDPAASDAGAEDLDSAKWKPILKLRGIVLSSVPRIHGFEGKSGAAWRIAEPTTDAQIPAADCVPLVKIVDLTSGLDAHGRLVWDAPPGTWRILRLGHTSTGHRNETAGGGKGLECDKFNPTAVRMQFDHWFAEAVRQVGPDLARRVLTVFHIDSWECGSQNWSAAFRDEFRRRRCYDPWPYLPAMAGIPVESADISERFLRDVRLTITELLSDNFFGTMAELARAHGCAFSAESVAPTMVSDGMEHFGRVDLPMGEFWLRSPTHDKLNDMLDAISGARAYGRPVVQAEAFTELSLAWDESPHLLKPLQDRNYALGANQFALHVFAHNPWLDRRPGMTLSGVGVYFQRDQTWWHASRAWIEYSQRCQAMLRQGHAVADIAVFTGEEIPRRAYVPWHLASTLPGLIKPVPAPDPARKRPQIVEAADWIDPLHGYAYDSINRDALLRNATIGEGRISMPGGANYRVLIVPARNPMSPIPDALTPETVSRLKQFVDAGGTLILGERPARSPSLERGSDGDAGVALAMRTLWPKARPADGKANAVGSGKVVTGPYAEASFAGLGLTPDLLATEGTSAGARPRAEAVAWTHRAGDDWDLYFVSNQRDAAREVNLSLRVGDRVPEIWDPVTGGQERAANWCTREGRTELTLDLPASGSVFVVFRAAKPADAPAPQDGSSAMGTLNGAELPVAQTISGPWTVSFDPRFNGPKAPVAFETLASWTMRTEPEIRFYSGTARYRCTFAWRSPNGSRPQRVWLDLGQVREVAEITVNGVICGEAWTPPYRVDIASALRDGENELQIDVTNTWFNRLAGDRELPTTQRTTWTTAPDRTQGKPLLESGLIGPVTLRTQSTARE